MLIDLNFPEIRFALQLLPDGWVELKISGCRCYFRTFQLELDNLGTKNFEIGSVAEKLQPFEVGQDTPKSLIWMGYIIPLRNAKD